MLLWICDLRNKQGNALLRAASGLAVPNSHLCQLGTRVLGPSVQKRYRVAGETAVKRHKDDDLKSFSPSTPM